MVLTSADPGHGILPAVRSPTFSDIARAEQTSESRDRYERMKSKARVKEEVSAMLGSQLRTTLSDGRFVEGKFQCMDRLTNFILADAVETLSPAATASEDQSGESNKPSQGVQRHLGLVMIPGKHLVRVERIEGP